MSSSPPTTTGITRFIPGLALIKGFSPALLRTELVVAITVFAVLVPSAMAYGDLAGVTPVAGLYVALGAMVMYALFGTSKQVIMGPEATAAIMTATAVAPLAGGDAARYAALAAMTRTPRRRRGAARPCRAAGVHHRPPVQAGAGRLHLRRDADRHRQPVGQDVRHQARERQVLPAGGGTHQPPRRSAPAHRRHWRRLHGGAAHHAPRESQAARPAHRRRRRHYRLRRVRLGGQGRRGRRRGAGRTAKGDDPRGHGARYLCAAACRPGPHDPDLCR